MQNMSESRSSPEERGGAMQQDHSVIIIYKGFLKSKKKNYPFTNLQRLIIFKNAEK